MRGGSGGPDSGCGRRVSVSPSVCCGVSIDRQRYYQQVRPRVTPFLRHSPHRAPYERLHLSANAG